MLDLREIRITGWTDSKAAANDDGGLSALLSFLERRATLSAEKIALSRGQTARPPVKIKKV